jgi:hypothetical protein
MGDDCLHDVSPTYGPIDRDPSAGARADEYKPGMTAAA